jgi:hypothetical protein
VLGPALGGVLVAAGSPGGALLVDAATFGAAAILMARVQISKRDDSAEPEPFLAELREGWNEFRRQTWIWTTIAFFGVANFVSMSVVVLGPLISKEYYSGARTWAIVVSSFGVGTIFGGFSALRLRPFRPLLVSCVAAVPVVMQPFGWAFHAPVVVLVAINAVAGIGIAVHLALWFTTFQRNVPEAALSRVSSYDALGSFVLIPVGAAIAGPIASAIGVTETLVATAVIELVCFAIIIVQPSVWAITRLSAAEPVAA